MYLTDLVELGASTVEALQLLKVGPIRTVRAQQLTRAVGTRRRRQSTTNLTQQCIWLAAMTRQRVVRAKPAKLKTLPSCMLAALRGENTAPVELSAVTQARPERVTCIPNILDPDWSTPYCICLKIDGARACRPTSQPCKSLMCYCACCVSALCTQSNFSQKFYHHLR